MVKGRNTAIAQICHCEDVFVALDTKNDEAISILQNFISLRLYIFSSVILCLFLSTANAKYSGGNGEPDNPYLIASPQDLCLISSETGDWNKCFKVKSNINLSGYSYSMIGIYGNPFTGIFDGNDFLIYNLTIAGSNVKYMGFFGCTGSSAQIKNVILVNTSIHNEGECSATGALVGYNSGYILNCYSTGNNSVSAEDCMGGLIGYNNGGTVEYCSFDADSVSGDGYTGGLIGYNKNGILSRCSVTGNVTGSGSVGGLVGYNYYGNISKSYINVSVNQVCSLGCFYAGGLAGVNYYGSIANCQTRGVVSGSTVFGGMVGLNYHGEVYDSSAFGNVIGDGIKNDLGGFVGVNQFGTISRCYAKGNVSSGGDDVGGFAGQNVNDSLIENCYAAGQVVGNSGVGGLAGLSDSDSRIVHCYSSGSVSGNSNVGGFIGQGSSSSGLYTKCFWFTDVNPSLSGIGNISPVPSDVKGLSSLYIYTRRAFMAWDLVNIWDIGDDQTFPFLRKYNVGDLNHDGVVNMQDLAVFAANWLNDK